MKAHVVSAAAARGEAPFERLVAALAPARPEYFQIREKEEPDRRLVTRTRAVRTALPRETLLLVNGRPDVAVAGGADGVQLPSDGLPPEEVRRAFPPPFLVGVSCHSLEEVRRAAGAGADFALFSPIYESAWKAPAAPPHGPEVLDTFEPPLPLHVLGGITLERLAAWPPARLRKVSTTAGIGLFADAADPARVVAALRALPGAS